MQTLTVPNIAKWLADEQPYVLDEYLLHEHKPLDAVAVAGKVISGSDDNAKIEKWLEEHYPDELEMYNIVRYRGDV